MSFPNEHNINIKNTDEYKTIERDNDKLDDGVHAIYGRNDSSKNELVSIRFSKDKFTPKQAQLWLKCNKYDSSFDFEPASRLDSVDVICDVQRVDNNIEFFSKVVKTDEGYFVGNVPIAKIDVYEYFLSDGSIQRELVDAETLSNVASNDSLKLKPVTNSHPPERLINKNHVKKRQIGTTGETVEFKKDFLFTKVSINTDEGVTSVEGGKRELSPGYTCDLIKTPGTFNNKKFDVIQRNRKYNHVAICDEARGGHELAIRIDSLDRFDSIPKDNKDFNIDNNKNNNPKGVKNMATFRIDEKDHEAASEVISYIGRQDEKIATADKKFDELEKASKKETEDLKAKLDEKEKTLQKTTAERDDAKAKLDEVEKVDIDAEVQKRVDEKTAVLETASIILDSDEYDKIKTDSTNEIKKTVVIKRFPTAKLDEKTEDYIGARFDGVVDSITEDEKSNINRQKAAATPKFDGKSNTSSANARAEAAKKENERNS